MFIRYQVILLIQEHCKTFNILPLPSLLVYFNSIYGYQIVNNSVPNFLRNLFTSVNNRYPRRDVFKFNPCNDIKINTSIAKSYNDLPVSFRSMTRMSVLNAVYLNTLSHLNNFLLFFFFLSFCHCVKQFALYNVDCKILHKKSDYTYKFTVCCTPETMKTM